MKCPVCNINLQMSQENGIRLDHCPMGRGVRLDNSKVSKIIKSISPHIRESGPVLHGDSEKINSRKIKKFAENYLNIHVLGRKKTAGLLCVNAGHGEGVSYCESQRIFLV